MLEKKKKAMKIIQILKRRYGLAGKRGEVPQTSFRRPFEVLVSCVLSQRTKDETTVAAAKRLFKVANTPKKMLKLSTRQIAKLIYPVGFFNQKAKRIKQISKILLERYGVRVPRTREELMKLPGVGGKSADIVLSICFNQPIIACDTHVEVISQRLGWTKEKTPEKIRRDLHTIFPPRSRSYVNITLVEFGKEICRKYKPKCYVCPIEKLCPYPNKNL